MARVWYTSEDGEIEYESLTTDRLQGALDVLRKGFYPCESACIASRLPEHPEAVPELDDLTMTTARDGVTVVAVEKRTRTVVGVAFNKLQVKFNPEGESYFENYAKRCKHSSSRSVIKFMKDADDACDLFEHCDVDCLLEIMFLAVLPEFRRRGVGTNLCQASIRLAEALLNGKNVKQSIDGRKLDLEPVPRAIGALFTSPASQKLGRKLGFGIAARISYDKFFYGDQTFSSVLGDEVPDTTLEYKKLV